MVIGALTINLQVPTSTSLKDKRQVLRSLTARVRQTFNVAVAEVGDQELWQAAVVGVVCVSSDSRHVDDHGEALVTGSRFELLHV